MSNIVKYQYFIVDLDEFEIVDKPYSQGRIRGTLEITDKTNGNWSWYEWKVFEDGYSDRDFVIEMVLSYLMDKRKSE